MAASAGITREALRDRAEQVGMRLTDAEVEHLQAIYDFYAPQLRTLHDVELAAEDLAVVFSPHWDQHA